MGDCADYVNGFIERKKNGTYQGSLTIDGVNLEGGIEATYFKDDGKDYVWLKRRPCLEYDTKTNSYKTRKREPQWEVYLQKQVDNNIIAYKGTFTFFHFRYSIIGIWDRILGKETQRLNLYVERLPMNQQTILHGINERKRNEHK